MGVLIAAVVINSVFVIFLATAYVHVARRRWKIYLLVEHLATLARQGLPLHSGLRAVGRDLGGFLGLRVTRVAQQLEEGRSLADAFASAPRTFPPLLRSMMALGEKSGNLAAFLEELRRSYRRIADLPYQSVYLFIYPLILSVCINAALTGLYLGIVPKFTNIYHQLGVSEVPFETWWSWLMNANQGILILCILTILLLLTGGTSVHYGSSILRVLKRGTDRALLFLPVVGKLLKEGAIQQFALCSGLFLRSGATLSEAVAASAGVERNLVLRSRLERMARSVAEGSRLSAAAGGLGLFGDDALWFIETGEASGLMADHLLLTAVHYETKVRLVARLAARAVVPFFVLLNGVIVFFAFMIIYMPTREILRVLTGD